MSGGNDFVLSGVDKPVNLKLTYILNVKFCIKLLPGSCCMSRAGDAAGRC